MVITTDYKVGELIYDANIYDGLNTSLSASNAECQQVKN